MSTHDLTPPPAAQVASRAVGEAFHREQAQLGVMCDLPGCGHRAVAGSPMCEDHELVRVASNGSWVPDSHADGGHG